MNTASSPDSGSVPPSFPASVPPRPRLEFDLDRRRFLAASGLALSGLAFAPRTTMAGPFDASDFEKLVPKDKKLSADWIASLTRRGEPETLRGRELEYVGMPVGGIACGQLYLSGDGRLGYWDIFRPTTTTDYDGKIWSGPKYAKPVPPGHPVEQGFAIRVGSGPDARVLPLDRRGFRDVAFRGEYPIGRVSYREAGLPVTVDLEAFSPFLPLDVEDSSLPATILEFTIRNPGTTPIEVTVAGWLENAVCQGADSGAPLRRRTSIRHAPGRTHLLGLSEAKPATNEPSERPDIVFAHFEDNDYGAWKEEGTAFGGRPARRGELPDRLAVTGHEGRGLVHTHQARAGEDSEASDKHVGRLTSPEFTVARRYIHFRIGGGKHPGQTGLHLLVDGTVVAQATGENGNAMRQAWFDVRKWEGRTARLEIVDSATGGWGHISVDHIVFADRLPSTRPEDVPGHGSLGLTLLGDAAGVRAASDVGARPVATEVFTRLEEARDGVSGSRDRFGSLDERTCGALSRTLVVPAGGEVRVTWIVSWWFPFYGKVTGEMAVITDIHKLRRHYARRFDDAQAVAEYVAGNLERLAGTTRLWNRTWYESSLPYWFLDRTFVTADCLATQTLHRFDNGRWWGWEGVDCCPGTCQHVWQYAQAAARLFPEMERDWRERVDFGLAWRAGGAIDYRSESGRDVAHDGFCGTLVRVYREHQMSPDDAFLRRIWPKVRKSIEFILAEDKDADGILEGRQFNTLDAAWHGPMAWISSLYLAALASGEAMATEMGDSEIAARCRTVLQSGRANLVKQLYNGEYFIHRPPDFKSTNTNDGCHIDQLMGQSLAFQVGLPRVVPEKESLSALRSLWTYSFTPDIGPYREGMKPILPSGRWYAMAGEGGLLMCTWPKGGAEKAAGGGNPTFVGYFIECMTGFEYQVAAHMVWEGLVTEGLAVTRAVHDRYAAAKRNPYNEIECSDHYSRAMMSYGVYLAACGFEYHGPKAHIGFAPRLGGERFQAAFTAAEGWGSYWQTATAAEQTHRVEVRWGRLQTASIALAVPEPSNVRGVRVTLGGRPLGHRVAQDGKRVVVTLEPPVSVVPEAPLQVDLALA